MVRSDVCRLRSLLDLKKPEERAEEPSRKREEDGAALSAGNPTILSAGEQERAEPDSLMCDMQVAGSAAGDDVAAQGEHGDRKMRKGASFDEVSLLAGGLSTQAQASHTDSHASDPSETVRNFRRHMQKRQKEMELFSSLPYEDRQKLDLRDDPFNIWRKDAEQTEENERSGVEYDKSGLEYSQGQDGQAKGFSAEGDSKDSKAESAGFGYERLRDEELRQHVESVLGRPGFDPASGRMEPQWYVLHTMHANLSEHQVSLNCQLRNAVKDGNDDEVEELVEQGAMINQPMPDYIYPTDNYEDAVLAVVWPPLHWAASQNLASTIVKLVQLGADVDGIDATATTGRYYWDDQCPIRSQLSDEESRKNYNLQVNAQH